MVRRRRRWTGSKPPHLTNNNNNKSRSVPTPADKGALGAAARLAAAHGLSSAKSSRFAQVFTIFGAHTGQTPLTGGGVSSIAGSENSPTTPARRKTKIAAIEWLHEQHSRNVIIVVDGDAAVIRVEKVRGGLLRLIG
jgi:hypothetical protein